ncbi:MAG: hypothetical protein FD149_2408 [Rhodospirillaceae bacterium]|nr:MAG: hypothetical protein FD149_2408 [Rhodospirillaceae bacterium]
MFPLCTLSLCRPYTFLVLCIAMMIPGRAILAAEVLTSDLLTEAFGHIVFQTESGAGSTGKPLVRWGVPIVAHLDGGMSEQYKPKVEKIFATLSKLTGLPMGLAPHDSAFNFEIHFMPMADVRRITKSSTIRCSGVLKGSSRDYLIARAIVYIANDDDHRIRHCLHEEIGRVLGLTNDSSLIADSLFNDTNDSRRSYSLSDMILIRALYDRRLRPGMSRKEAMPIARIILRELATRLKEAGKM